MKFGASGVSPIATDALIVRFLLNTWLRPKLSVDAVVWLPGTRCHSPPGAWVRVEG